MISILFLVFSLCILSLFNQIENFDLLLIIFIIIFAIVFLVDIYISKKYRRFLSPLSCGLVLRILLLFYDVYTENPLHLPLLGGPLSSDPLRFYRTAINSSLGYATSYGGFFPKFLGVFFKYIRPSRLLAEYIVLLFSVATIIVAVNILTEFNISEPRKKMGVYLIALLPNYAFLSAVLRRETVISFFVALSVLYFLKWYQNTAGETAFLLSFVFALFASLFHGAIGMIIVPYLFLRIIYNPKTKSFTLDGRNLFIALFFFGVVMIIYSQYGNIFFGKIEQRIDSGSLSSTRDVGGSSYAKYVGDARNPLRMVIFALPRLFYFLFSPLPWQWRGISDIIAFVAGSLVYLIIIVKSLIYIRNNPKDDENRKLLIALLLILILVSSVFSWGVTNTGTATRHRDKIVVIYVAIFAISMEKQSKKELEPTLSPGGNNEE